jgi:hypothetical protein
VSSVRVSGSRFNGGWWAQGSMDDGSLHKAWEKVSWSHLCIVFMLYITQTCDLKLENLLLEASKGPCWSGTQACTTYQH